MKIIFACLAVILTAALTLSAIAQAPSILEEEDFIEQSTARSTYQTAEAAWSPAGGNGEPISSPSIYIKLDVDDFPNQLWDFRWKAEHHTLGGDGSRGDLPSYCGLWLREEEGRGRDKESWTVVQPGSIIRKNAISLYNSITEGGKKGNSYFCHTEGDVCYILSASFNTNPQGKCNRANSPCLLSDGTGSRYYKPIGDIICAVGKGNTKGAWYLCRSQAEGYVIEVDGKKYTCRNNGQQFGEWKPDEDCSVTGDEDGDEKPDCADEECYGTDRSKIRVKGGESILEHEADKVSGLDKDPSVKVYYHPLCDPDEYPPICTGENIKFSFNRLKYGYLAYNPESKCCGDDIAECGKKVVSGSDNYLCGTALGKFEWMKAKDKTGDVLKFKCKDKYFLSDGADWKECNGATNKLQVKIGKDNYDYLCAAAGSKDAKDNDVGTKWIKCCGDDNSCASTSDTIVKLTGGYVNDSNSNKAWYCRQDKTFTTELDTQLKKGNADLVLTNKADLDYYKAQNEINKKTCEAVKNKAGNAKIAAWTGTKCCGEHESSKAEEYYQDPVKDYDGKELASRVGDNTNVGICIENTFIKDGEIAPKTGVGLILSSEGRALGCPVPSTTSNLLDLPELRGLVPLGQCHIDKYLVADKPICSPKTGWKKLSEHFGVTHTGTSAQIPSDYNFNLSQHPTDTQNKECCPAAECWNGATNKCVPNVGKSTADKPESQFDNDADAANGLYRCILKDKRGQWKLTKKKKSLLENADGFCDSDEQCLVTTNDDATEKCIAGGNYFITAVPDAPKDNFCDGSSGQGVWTSRTRLVAAQLLNLVPPNSDYSLYCGRRDLVLNGRMPLRNFNELTDNNVCVLKKGERVTLGFVLSKEVSQVQQPIKDAFGKECNFEKTTDLKFTLCKKKSDNSEDKSLWYSPDLNALIYDKDTMTISPSGLVIDANTKITAPMDDIIQKFSVNLRPQPKYDNIYMAKSGGKTIQGFLLPIDKTEGKSGVIGVKYEGFGNICGAAKVDVQGSPPATTPNRQSVCIAQAQSQFIIKIHGDEQKDSAYRLFADLTAKIRIERFAVLQQLSARKGDFNNDQKIDSQDLSAILKFLGKKIGDAEFDSKYDMDGNNNIEFSDVVILADNFDDKGSAILKITISPDKADFNQDKIIDLEDFFDFAVRFGTSFGSGGYSTDYDLSKDGKIDLTDFYIFAAHFGKKV